MSPIERSSGGGGGGFSNPMTTAGDIIIENAVPAPARLGIGAAGQVLGISGGLPAWVYPPSFEFGYDQITAFVAVTATTEAAPTTVITCAAHTFDGSPVMCEVFSPFFQNASAGIAQCIMSIWEGAAEISRLGLVANGGGAQFDLGTIYQYRFTPSAAAHTYLIRGWAPNQTSTPGVGAGTGVGADWPPAFCRFTKV